MMIRYAHMSFVVGQKECGVLAFGVVQKVGW